MSKEKNENLLRKNFLSDIIMTRLACNSGEVLSFFIQYEKIKNLMNCLHGLR